MRDHSHHIEVTRDDAVRLLLEHAAFSPRTERVSLEASLGRVLANDVRSAADVPNARSCRMDSVAVHWSDFADGMPDTTGWRRGVEWEFANTGIVMPEGFDTAIMIEQVTLGQDLSRISFSTVPEKQYAGTAEVGSRIAKGDVLARAGQVVTPLLSSGIAAGSVEEVDVIAGPVVAFIPTGNELVPRMGVAPLGKNVETNSLLFSQKICGWGAQPLVWNIVPDDPELIKQAVAGACKVADIVVLNAGSSKGSDDWNVEMLEEEGAILYHQTNHGPGHHCSGAVVDGTVVVGISGPPGGVSFTTDFYVYPLIMSYLGQPTALKRVAARLAEDMTSGRPGHAPRGKGKAPEGGRPGFAGPEGLFFGVKQVQLRLTEDGAIEACPARSAHLSEAEANEMDGYFLLSNQAPLPRKGDIIQVEIRP